MPLFSMLLIMQGIICDEPDHPVTLRQLIIIFAACFLLGLSVTSTLAFHFQAMEECRLFSVILKSYLVQLESYHH